MKIRIAYLEEPEPTAERMQLLCDYISFVVGELEEYYCVRKSPMPISTCRRLAEEGGKTFKTYYRGSKRRYFRS